MRISTAPSRISIRSCLGLVLSMLSTIDLENDIVHPLGQLSHRMILLKSLSGCFAHPSGLVRILPQLQDCLPHALNIAWFYQQSCMSILNIGFCTGRSRCHDGLAKTHCMEQAAVASSKTDLLEGDNVE